MALPEPTCDPLKQFFVIYPSPESPKKFILEKNYKSKDHYGHILILHSILQFTASVLNRPTQLKMRIFIMNSLEFNLK